jgi:hypothetical protein
LAWITLPAGQASITTCVIPVNDRAYPVDFAALVGKES